MSTWLTALKTVPWGELIAVAPAVSRGARRLFKRGVEEPSAEETVPRSMAVPNVVEALQNALDRLQAQQQASVQAVHHLTEQNRQLLESITALRIRCHLLTWLCSLLALVLFCLMAWVVWQAWF